VRLQGFRWVWMGQDLIVILRLEIAAGIKISPFPGAPGRPLDGSSMGRFQTHPGGYSGVVAERLLPKPDAEFVTSVPWGLTGGTVVLDGHSHTRFSDGALSPQELATEALLNGCGALAITDHGDLWAHAADSGVLRRDR